MERAEPELVIATRRARRGIRGFRLAFYPAAAIVVVLLLGRDDGERQSAWLDGRTAQGHAISMRIEDGRPSLGTRLVATCPNGGRWQVGWWTSASRSSVDLDGEVLRVRDTVTRAYNNGEAGRRSFSMRARVEDDAARGTLSFVEAVTTADGNAYECRSGPVSFSARTAG